MTDFDVSRIPGDGTFEDARAVRRDVFIEEQDVSEAEEWDGHDDDAIHYVVYDGEEPVGTARLRTPEDDIGKAERVAVLEAHRGDGIGRRLMTVLEDEARDQGCSRMRLHAQTAVEGFYETLGYEAVSDEFEEAGIPHVEMVKALE